jgi:hypothetical protein
MYASVSIAPRQCCSCENFCRNSESGLQFNLSRVLGPRLQRTAEIFFAPQSRVRAVARIMGKGGIHEKKHLFVGTCAACVGWLRQRTDDSDNHDNYPGSDHNRPSPRGGGGQDSAGSSCGNPNRGTRARICLDEGLLAMGRIGLCVGARDLGGAPQAGRGVGGKPLGPSPRRLGVDRGSLAVIVNRINTNDGRVLPEGVFKSFVV